LLCPWQFLLVGSGSGLADSRIFVASSQGGPIDVGVVAVSFASSVKRRKHRTFRGIGKYALGAIFAVLLIWVILIAIAAATGHIE
jgi:hypothetical protein